MIYMPKISKNVAIGHSYICGRVVFSQSVASSPGDQRRPLPDNPSVLNLVGIVRKFR